MLALILWMLASPARAYETDQLTGRGKPLADAREPANAKVDELVARAIATTNKKTRCQASVDRTRRLLAKRIWRETAKAHVIMSRLPARSFGNGVYSAWMETADIPRRDFSTHESIFGDITSRESFILYWARSAATVNIDGVLAGTDKFHHFFSEGYKYYRKSGWGRDDEAALVWGTHTEMTVWGWDTSRTFSFADLVANAQGYRFYDELLEPTSAIAIGPAGSPGAGCVHQVRSFDWGRWVDWRWDEVLNPSVFRPRVQESIDQHLREHRDEICREYAIWGGPVYVAHLGAVLSRTPTDARGLYMARTDPFQLQALCAGEVPWSPAPVAAASPAR